MRTDGGSISDCLFYRGGPACPGLRIQKHQVPLVRVERSPHQRFAFRCFGLQTQQKITHKKINDVTSEQCGRLCLFIVHAHLGLTCRLCAFFQLRFRQGFFFPRGKRAGHRQNQLELLQLPMLYITLAPFQLQGLVKPLLPRLMRLSTKSGT